MKKIVSFAALLLTAAGSWAFYPKSADTTSYMTVGLYIHGSSTTHQLVMTAPDGSLTKQNLERKKDLAEMRAQLLVKVNELHRDGWQVVQMTPNAFPGSFSESTDYEDVYLLEKR